MTETETQLRRETVSELDTSLTVIANHIDLISFGSSIHMTRGRFVNLLWIFESGTNIFPSVSRLDGHHRSLFLM